MRCGGGRKDAKTAASMTVPSGNVNLRTKIPLLIQLTHESLISRVSPKERSSMGPGIEWVFLRRDKNQVGAAVGASGVFNERFVGII